MQLMVLQCNGIKEIALKIKHVRAGESIRHGSHIAPDFKHITTINLKNVVFINGWKVLNKSENSLGR